MELDGSGELFRLGELMRGWYTARRKATSPASGTRLLIFGQTGVAVWFLGKSGQSVCQFWFTRSFVSRHRCPLIWHESLQFSRSLIEMQFQCDFP